MNATRQSLLHRLADALRQLPDEDYELAQTLRTAIVQNPMFREAVLTLMAYLPGGEQLLRYRLGNYTFYGSEKPISFQHVELLQQLLSRLMDGSVPVSYWAELIAVQLDAIGYQVSPIQNEYDDMTFQNVSKSNTNQEG